MPFASRLPLSSPMSMDDPGRRGLLAPRGTLRVGLGPPRCWNGPEPSPETFVPRFPLLLQSTSSHPVSPYQDTTLARRFSAAALMVHAWNEAGFSLRNRGEPPALEGRPISPSSFTYLI